MLYTVHHFEEAGFSSASYKSTIKLISNGRLFLVHKSFTIFIIFFEGLVHNSSFNHKTIENKGRNRCA